MALRIYTLGRFALVKDEKPVRFSRKAPQKPLIMLKVLIALGGRRVREYQISDILWPDTNGDIAHTSFATTLHRLRKLIGHHTTVELRDGCMTLDQRYCWVDVWAFERIFGQADAMWKKASPEIDITKAIELTQKAINIYHGPFLPDENEELWTISLREHLGEKFMRCVNKLGHHWEMSGQYEKAVESYRRGLEVDDLAEEFYRHLMACYHRLGQLAEALSVYNRGRKILFATLGIEPSPKTEAIRKSLLSEKKS